jgi:hypothetical protein
MNSNALLSHLTHFGQVVERVNRLGALLRREFESKPQWSNRRIDPAGKGYVFCGPRHDLSSGNYCAYFWLDVPENIGSVRIVLDAISWQGDIATNLGDASFALSPGPKRAALLTFRFSVPERRTVEARAWSDENGDELRVSRILVCRLNETLLPSQRDLKVAAPILPKLFGTIFDSFRRQDLEAVITHGQDDGAPLDLWLAFGSKIGCVHVQTVSELGRQELAELVGITNAKLFSIDRHRSVLFVPAIADMRAESVTLFHNQQETELRLPRREIQEVHSKLTNRLRLRVTDVSDVLAHGIAVRLRYWGVDEHLNPTSLDGSIRSTVEQTNAVLELKTDTVTEFARCSRAFFIFETGPDCGIVDVEWGHKRCRVNLYERSPGAIMLFVPDDIVRKAAGAGRGKLVGMLNARDQHGDHGTGDTVDIFAIGHHHPASKSVEIAVRAVWTDYPLERIAHDRIECAGDFERRWDMMVVCQGSVRFTVGKMPAIEMLRYDWGGICIVRYGRKLIIVDTYGPVREQFMVLPALDRPILSRKNGLTGLDGKIVHPALADFFQRRRPRWLSADKN